jgi:hypothetical protein
MHEFMSVEIKHADTNIYIEKIAPVYFHITHRTLDDYATFGIEGDSHCQRHYNRQ